MTDQKTKVAASILAGDFARLGEEAKRIEDSGADAIHLDIMDGHFVPNLTMGPRMVAAINRSTDLFLDVHLMMYNPFAYIQQFVEAGADLITFHLEATEDVEDTLNYIRKCGVLAGLALNPETSISLALKYFYISDVVLLMSVHPGFAGQEFIPQVVEKIAIAKDFCIKNDIGLGDNIEKKDLSRTPFTIQVDGGINKKTAQQCIKAGANFIVSGSYLFNMANMAEGVSELKNIV